MVSKEIEDEIKNMLPEKIEKLEKKWEKELERDEKKFEEGTISLLKELQATAERYEKEKDFKQTLKQEFKELKESIQKERKSMEKELKEALPAEKASLEATIRESDGATELSKIAGAPTQDQDQAYAKLI